MIKRLLALFGLQFKQVIIIIKETGSYLGILRMIFYLVWFALLGFIVGRKWDGSPKIRAEICKESYCIHCNSHRRKCGGRWNYIEIGKVSMK